MQIIKEKVPNDNPPKSWNRRMAEELYEMTNSLTAEAIYLALEAAGELKAVQLKVLLAHCYEVIAHAGDGANPDDGLLDEIMRAIR